MYILSAKCPVLSVKMISSFFMGMQFHSSRNRVHIPVSNVYPSLASVLSRAPCVTWTLDTGHWTLDREQCVRDVSSDKSEVNRWTMAGYAAQLN